jgi:hypothetical protein
LNADWHPMCSVKGVNHSVASMFKITHNTVFRFSLAEILLMAAMNQLEASGRCAEMSDTCPADSLSAGRSPCGHVMSR